MKKLFILICVCAIAVGCKSKKGIVTKRDRSKETTETVAKTEDEDIDEDNVMEEVAEDLEVPVRKFKNATEEYIYTYKAIAVDEMRKYKIPASITLAQGILESGSGRGRLAKEANNHFGIKCHGWTGKKIYHDDDAKQECFRSYGHAKSSYEDHSQFLTSRGRYADLFKLREGDYKAWAKGLRKAGYATDRKYPEKLIGLIERYELYKYDALVLNGEETAFLERELPKVEEERSNRNEQKENAINHRVKRGDTLYSLSKRYGTTVDRIKQLNNLRGTNLEIGQILIIK